MILIIGPICRRYLTTVENSSPRHCQWSRLGSSCGASRSREADHLHKKQGAAGRFARAQGNASQVTECGQRVSRTIPMTLELGLPLTCDLLARRMLAMSQPTNPGKTTAWRAGGGLRRLKHQQSRPNPAGSPPREILYRSRRGCDRFEGGNVDAGCGPIRSHDGPWRTSSTK